MSVGSEEIKIGVFDHTGASMGGGTLVAAHLASRLSRVYSVDLIRDWSGFALQELASAFSLDLATVKVRHYEGMWDSFAVPGPYPFSEQLRRSRALTSGYDVFVYSGHWAPPFCYAKHGVIYCHFPIGQADGLELTSEKRWTLRNSVDRRLRRKAYRLAWRVRLGGYRSILANSAFTAAWIERRWRTRSDVIYPPIDLEVPSAEKQNRIVSIGRFFGIEPRCKGHLAQVAAFREFLSRTSGHWEMRMIGACHSEKDRAYLAEVQAAGRDLPIQFLVNVDRDTIVNSLAGAKMFWHTAGMFENKAENPVFAEHFGMATVEAMRAGCVPIVIDSGGQREIIHNGVDGFLCENLSEVVKYAAEVAEDASLRDFVMAKAKERSMDFTGEVFDRRIVEMITGMLSERTKGWSAHAALNAVSRAAIFAANVPR